MLCDTFLRWSFENFIVDNNSDMYESFFERVWSLLTIFWGHGVWTWFQVCLSKIIGDNSINLLNFGSERKIIKLYKIIFVVMSLEPVFHNHRNFHLNRLDRLNFLPFGI